MLIHTIYSPEENNESPFDIGIHLPSFDEGINPFDSLKKWLDAIVILQKKYRVLILILVNGRTDSIDGNLVTLGFGEALKGLLEGETQPEIFSDIAPEKLCEDLLYLIYRNSERVKIVIGERYDQVDTIGRVRHLGCTYLKQNLHELGIIVSTDADSEPSDDTYLQNVVDIFEGNPEIMGVTGNFQTKILTTETTRTYNYANYEKLSRRLFDIFILSPLPNDSLDQSSQLTTMSGCNTVFRANIYDECIRFSNQLGTGEDMDFSRKMLESNLVVIYDPAICITTQYRPSERTEYGLGTEVQKVNSNTEFQVYHPLVYLGISRIHFIFEHVSEYEGIEAENQISYLMECLINEFGSEIVNDSIVNQLRVELEKSRGLLIGRPMLNDKALRIIGDRLKEYHSRLSIEGAYEWIIEFVYNQMLQISIGSTGQYLLGRFDEELKALRHYDRNCSNYEVFLVAILKNIQVSLFSVYRNEYQNEVLRLEPIPSPETHSIV